MKIAKSKKKLLRNILIVCVVCFVASSFISMDFCNIISPVSIPISVFIIVIPVVFSPLSIA